MADVLRAQSPHDGQSSFSSSPLLHANSPPQSSLFVDSTTYPLERTSNPSSYPRHIEDPSRNTLTPTDASSPTLSHTELSRSPSFHSTPPSSISLNSAFQSSTRVDDHDDHDDGIFFPTYDSDFSSKGYHQPSMSYTQSSPEDPAPVPKLDTTDSSTIDDSEPHSPGVPHGADDTEIRDEPSRQVDYLSHDWREEDIWSSWKHIVSNRRQYGERSRLENASWRTWAKSKYRLKTVSPERLNWLKDCDVTWLYGPLQQGNANRQNSSEPTSHLSKNDSFINKKSNLKKRSVSEVMLQKSISSSSLVKQAAAAVQAQRSSPTGRPAYGRSRSECAASTPAIPASTADFSLAFPSTSTSGLQSPDGQGKRHIRFDTTVEQCIAVDYKEDGVDYESQAWENALNSPSSSEDDLPIMKTRVRGPSKPCSRTPSSRNSFSNDGGKGIVKLPSTRLKFHADEADGVPPSQIPPHPSASVMVPTKPTLDKSPSQETLRPTRPSSNFLIDEDPSDSDMDWEPSGAFGSSCRVDDSNTTKNIKPHQSTLGPVSTLEEEQRSDGLRRTPSGMFMPFEEDDDDENLANNGIFGRVVDTVNTARDIAHVIWNVGWRK